MAAQQNGFKKFSLKTLLIGHPLATKDLAHQTISKPVGLAVFASDALSSTAYATDEILLYLALAGTAAATLSFSLPIAAAIAILLIIVTISYRQTIHAYPNGGGAYIVARDNFGEVAAQVAGAALLTDYILTVAVSISSGVAQITSGFPALLPYRVEIALALIVIMTIINLRGVKESGSIFSVPTYFFLAMMFLTLGVGIYRYFTGTLPVVTGVEALTWENPAVAVTVFIALRAFSSGCTALTGIEAISNGITAFKEPRSKNAATTLMWMSGILITLFLGITFLANQIHAVHSETETVISQLARTTYGDGSIFYLMTLAGTTLILIMAANTSYADFPRLAALQAGDGYLPRQLTYRGSRLVFSWGITALAVAASLLVIVGDAKVSALIPLYAIGVFLSFTISQAGMVVHTWRLRHLQPGETHKGLESTLSYDPFWRVKIAISAVGAVCTFVVMIVFAVTKFVDGAWFVVILIPTLVFIFTRIHHHYKKVANSLRLARDADGNPIGKIVDSTPRPMQTLILVDNVHRETVQMVNFAKSLSHPWRAVHVATNPEKAAEIKELWDDYIAEGELEIIPSPYRALAAPIRDLLEDITEQNPNVFIHVIMGHLAMDNYWEQVLHQNTAFIFNLALADLDNVVATVVSYRVRQNGKVERENAALRAEPRGRIDRAERVIEKELQRLAKESAEAGMHE